MQKLRRFPNYHSEYQIRVAVIGRRQREQCPRDDMANRVAVAVNVSMLAVVSVKLKLAEL